MHTASSRGSRSCCSSPFANVLSLCSFDLAREPALIDINQFQGDIRSHGGLVSIKSEDDCLKESVFGVYTRFQLSSVIMVRS